MSPFEFSIPVHDLDAAGKEYRLVIRAAWLRGAFEGTSVTAAPEGDGEFNFRLSKSGNDVVVRGDLRAVVTVPCARCLEPATVVVHENLSLLALESGGAPRPKGGSADGDDDDGGSAGEADVISYDGQTVILDDLVRDEILLGIPMIPLCSDSCPGIRAEPAVSMSDAVTGDDGIDPRLQPLLRLKKT